MSLQPMYNQQVQNCLQLINQFMSQFRGNRQIPAERLRTVLIDIRSTAGGLGEYIIVEDLNPHELLNEHQICVYQCVDFISECIDNLCEMSSFVPFSEIEQWFRRIKPDVEQMALLIRAVS